MTIDLQNRGVEGGGGDLKPNSTVYVNSEFNFPSPVMGEHLLLPDTNYHIAQGVTYSNTLVPASGTMISGDGFYTENPVVYLGTSSAIRSENVAFQLSNIAISPPDCTEFMTCVGSVLNSVHMDRVRILSAPKLGTLNGMAMVFRDLICFQFSDGWTFLGGPIIGHSGNGASMLGDGSSGNIYWDWGGATFDNFDMIGVEMFASAPTDTYFSSSAGGANLSPNSDAFISECGFGILIGGGPGVGNPLSGFNEGFQTVGWEFSKNIPTNQVEETREVSQGILDTPITPAIVSISSAGVFEEMGAPSSGAWVDVGLQSRITTDANGVSTYNGNKPILLRLRYLATVTKVGGGSDQLEVRVAVNWTPGDTGDPSGALTRNNNETQVSAETEVTLNTGDNFRLLYANNTGTANIEVFAVKREVARI